MMNQGAMVRIAVFSAGFAGILAGASLPALAHEPFETAMPDRSHLHIKGRVTTPQSIGVGNAWLSPNTAMFVRGWPNGCVPSPPFDHLNAPGARQATEAPRTANDGSYHIVVMLVPRRGTDPRTCHDSLPNLSVDKAKMVWNIGPVAHD